MNDSDEYYDASTVELNIPPVSDNDNSSCEEEWEEEFDDYSWNWYWTWFFHDPTVVWSAAT
eukprot:2039214-Ditylum_brightwellii.AAC.1